MERCVPGLGGVPLLCLLQGWEAGGGKEAPSGEAGEGRRTGAQSEAAHTAGTSPTATHRNAATHTRQCACPAAAAHTPRNPKALSLPSPHAAGADCLSRGARAVEEFDVEAAVTMLYDAIDIYENEDREANAQDIFR